MRNLPRPNSQLVRAVEEIGTTSDYRDLRLHTQPGPVVIRYYESQAANCAVIMVGGVGGDFDTPAHELYLRLARQLKEEGIASLRVQFRDPIDLDDSTYDVLAGIEFLRTRGIDRVALVGHSFGGAVVIQASLRSQAVATVVTLATQGFGTDGVEDIAPRSILLIHGYNDEVLPPSCSIDAHSRAAEPKQLKLISGARHMLDEAADEVYAAVHDWIIGELNRKNTSGDVPWQG